MRTMGRLTPEAVYYNGTIYTQEEARPKVEALAVLNGRVVATGSSAELRELAGPGTKLVDLGGKTAIPGLTDAHVHFVMYGLSLSRVQLADTLSRAEAV